MPSNETAPLFNEAKRLALASVWSTELANENGTIRQHLILVERDGQSRRTARSTCHAEHEPERPFQHLEKRY